MFPTFDQTRRKIVICTYILTIIYSLFLPFYFLKSVTALIMVSIIIYTLCKPKNILIGFGIFILMQDLLVYRFSRDTAIGSLFLKADEIFILAIFLFSLFRRFIQTKETIWRKTPIDLPLICLIIISIISTVISRIVSFQIAIADLFILIKGWLIFYIFDSFDFTNKEIKKILRIFSFCGTIIIILGVVDLIAPYKFRSFINAPTYIDYRSGIPSIQSIFTHPGEAAIIFAIFSCMALAFMTFYKDKKFTFLFMAFLMGAALTMRRKPLLGIASIYLIVLLINHFYLKGTNKKKLIINLFILLIPTILLFLPKISDLFADTKRVYILGYDPLTIARNALYYTSYDLAKNYFPFGSGLGSFGGWVSAENYSPIYYDYGFDRVRGLGLIDTRAICDTTWPYIFGQFGFLGLLCYLFLIYQMVKICWIGIKELPSRIEKAFSLGTLLIIIETLVESLAYPVYFKAPAMYFLFGTVGIVYSLLSHHKPINRCDGVGVT